MKYTTIGAILGLIVAVIGTAQANPQVKYCKNYQTGQVIVVEAGYPCPYPTVEI